MTPESALTFFGKPSFRPMQRQIIDSVLARRAAIGVLPTGLGKSLCYQLPAILIDGVSIVVSPLIALMKDQVDALLKLDIHAARFDSSLSEKERSDVLCAIENSSLRLVFVAPESLESRAFSDAFSQARPGLFVIDEAHCLSEWGHSFRPDYLALPQYAASRNFHAVLALTATATPRVIDDLARMFAVQKEDIFRLPPSRSNIARSVSAADDKIKTLEDILRHPGKIPAIVYVRSRKDAEEISAKMACSGIKSKSYHAGMPTDARALVQGEFLTGEVPVLIATIAFGMGIDKPDVRSVIHFHPPSSPESYVQESGRAGRDGLSSESLVLIDNSDKIAARNRLHASVPDKESLRMLLSRLSRPGRNIVSVYEMTTSCDITEPVFQRILFDLSSRQLVSIESRGFKYYRVKPLFPLSTILSGRDENEKNILSWLDAHRDSDVEEFALTANLGWKEACDYLQDLVLSGEWQCTLRQAALELRVSPAGISANALADEFADQFAKRFQNDMTRLETIEYFLEEVPCINAAIDSYFGFDSPTCEHCSPCASGHSLGKLPPPDISIIPLEIFEEIRALSLQGKRELERATQMARFLLGLPGPAALRGRLWAHPLYGSLSGHPWSEVLAATQAVNRG